MIVDAVYDELEMFHAQWIGLLDRLHEGGHNMNSPRSSLRGLSTLLLDKRIKVTLEMLLSIRPSNDDDMAAMLLHVRAPEFRPLSQQLLNAISQALSVLNSQWQPATHIRDGGDSYQLILDRSDGSAAQIDLSDPFRQIGEATSSLTAIASQIVPLCRVDGVAEFSTRSNVLAQKINEVESLKVRAAASLSESEDAHRRAMDVEVETRQVGVQAAESMSRLRELVNQASTDSGQVTALTEQVRTIAANAETLNQVVTSYQPKFEAFQKSLDANNDDFLVFINDTETAKEKNAEREATITRLIAQSNDMLAGATTAGLGVTLEAARLRYEKRMESARTGFYLAVALLLVSAMPLAAHLIPNLFGSWIPALDPKADGSPFSVVGKVLLLLPATWLTAFFTQTYANLFQLEREYAHKAALAGAVHGFKLQAPKYEEEITAEVFMEIRTNPAHGPAVPAASHPLYDVLAKVVGKVLDKGKDKAEGKDAAK